MSDQRPVTINDMIEEIDRGLNFLSLGWQQRMQDAGLALRNQLQRRLDVMRAIKNHLERVRDRQ